MRFGFVLLALVAAAAGYPGHQRAADQDLLKKQQDTVYLLDQITQGLPNQELYNLGYNYDIVANAQHYTEPALVHYYGGMVRAGHVQPQGTVYCNSVSQLRKEVALLTRILLGADDYSTFLKTAAWARVYVNEGQFVKAYIAAILQREDTQGVIPPPIYEIYPHHYVDARVIQEAQNIHARGGEGLQQTVVIPVNYTDYLPEGEHQLSYFTNDVGLNAYYAYVTLAGYMIPEHVQKTGGYQHGHDYEGEHHIGRGARYYYLHQQLLAHYNLERLSNGLGPVEEVDFEHVHAPYKAHLRYTNGLEFPGRPEELHLAHTHHHSLIKNVYALEKRLLNAIDSGYVITPQQQFLSLYQPQGLNILGDLIEGTGRSVNPRYYGSLQAVARQLLGHTPEFVNIWSYTPSALELGETAVRDPAFYQLYKRVVKLFHRYQQSLPAYQHDDLVLPGVKIERVVFPDLVTYFDEHLINLENGIVQPETKEQRDTTIKAALHRLNHQQYEYQIQVQAEKPYTNAVVRVYLGPKFDYDGQPIDINHHRHYFVELDQFVHDLQEGKNVIVRNSQETPIHSADYPSVHQIKVHVDSAVRSQNPFYVTEPQHIFGFPARLSLPKGRHGGFPLQVFVIISSSEEHQVPYGPVVPAEYQTYHHHGYKIVTSEQYEQYTQQGHQQQTGGIHYGGHQTVEVVPHYEGHGIYGNELNKHHAYYGHYLYMKYPSQYPIYYQHYYGHGAGGSQQHGSYVHGHYQQHGVHGYAHPQQYPGQQGVTGQHGQYVQGQIYQGGAQGGQHLGGVHGGAQYQGGVQGGQHYQGGVLGGQHYQGGGVGGQQYQGGVLGGQHYGQVQEGGVETVVPAGQTGYQGQVGRGVHHGQTGHAEHLVQYYKGKHISEIIGGAISLDNRPLGFPLNRPLAPSVFYVPNIMVTDVIVYHEHNYPTHGTYQGRKEQQDGIHHGGQQSVEVVPHYDEHGIYGNELNKHLAYYGNYLYMKYPIYYQHYHYGRGVGGSQQNGSYVQGHDQQNGGVDTVNQGQVVRGVLKGQTGHSERLAQYYKGKHISEIIGGAISLDDRPLGFPFDRSLAPSARYVPNVMVTDVIVYHKKRVAQVSARGRANSRL